MPATAPTITSPSTMITNSPMRSMSEGVVAMIASPSWVSGGVHRCIPITNPSTSDASAIAHSQ